MTDTAPTEPLTTATPLKTYTLGDVIDAVGNSIVDDWWLWLLGAFALFVIGTVLWVARMPARDPLALPPRQRAASDADSVPDAAIRYRLENMERRNREYAILQARNTLLLDVQERIKRGLIDQGLSPRVAELPFAVTEEIRADFNAQFPLESPTRTTAERPRDPRADPSTARRQEFVDDWVKALHAQSTNPTGLTEGRQRSALTAALAPLSKVQAARKQRNANRKNDQLTQLAAAQQALADQATVGNTQGLQEQQQALTELVFQVQAINPAAPDAATRLDTTQHQLDQIAGVGVQQSQPGNRQVQSGIDNVIAAGRGSPEEEEKEFYRDRPISDPRDEPSGQYREFKPRID